MTKDEIRRRIQAAMDKDYQAWDVEQNATHIIELIESAGLEICARAPHPDDVGQ